VVDGRIGGLDDRGEVRRDLLLDLLDLAAHAAGVVDDEDDVDGAVDERRLGLLIGAPLRAAGAGLRADRDARPAAARARAGPAGARGAGRWGRRPAGAGAAGADAGLGAVVAAAGGRGGGGEGRRGEETERADRGAVHGIHPTATGRLPRRRSGRRLAGLV